MEKLGEHHRAEKAWNNLPKDTDALKYAQNRIEDLERQIWMHWAQMDSLRYEYEKRLDMLSGGE